MRTLNPNAAHFIQIHILDSRMHSNRNEDGTLKSIVFGEVTRSRASSQSQKYTYKDCADPELSLRTIIDPTTTLTVEGTIPSRMHFQRVFDALPKEGVDGLFKKKTVEALYDTFIGTKQAEGKAGEKAAQAKMKLAHEKEKLPDQEKALADAVSDKERQKAQKTLNNTKKRIQALQEELTNDEGDDTKQVILLGDPEVGVLIDLAHRALKQNEATPHAAINKALREWEKESGKGSARTMRLGYGIEAAVFGRPIYSGGLFPNPLAAAGFNHQIGVHEQRLAYDTFTAMDKLKKEQGEMGAGMFGENPLAHSIFYSYGFIDTRLLIKNIEGDLTPSTIAAEVVRRIILMCNRCSSKTKHGSLAAKTHALMAIAEVGDDQCANFENAFLDPVTVDQNHPNMLTNTLTRLAAYIQANDKAHPTKNQRAMTLVDISGSTDLPTVIPTVLNDKALAEWAVDTANAYGEDRTIRNAIVKAGA
jgi:hypothetical protein